MTTTKASGNDCWSRVAQVALSDETAFTELYQHFFPRVYQYLLGKTKNSVAADEVVSDVFMRMYRHLTKYDSSKGAFSTWLFRIAQSALSDYYRRNPSKNNVPLDDDFDMAAPFRETPEAMTLTKERNEELHRAIARLPEKQRQILEMTYWLGLKSGEIGETLGIPAGSVRFALKQARDQLRKLLDEK